MQLTSIWKRGLLVLLSAVAVSSLAGNVMLYRKVQELRSDPAMQQKDETAALVAAVGRLMVLPDEQPTVATVKDLEPLKGQPFFANAKPGDKVLMYAEAKMAVLYDPVADKIIEKAPLVSAEAQQKEDAAGGEDVEENP